MKTFLIWVGVSYLIQLMLVVFIVYRFNPKVKTIGQLVEALSEVPRPLWIPVLGLFLGILLGIIGLFMHIWPKLSEIRIKK